MVAKPKNPKNDRKMPLHHQGSQPKSENLSPVPCSSQAPCLSAKVSKCPLCPLPPWASKPPSVLPGQPFQVAGLVGQKTPLMLTPQKWGVGQTSSLERGHAFAVAGPLQAHGTPRGQGPSNHFQTCNLSLWFPPTSRGVGGHKNPKSKK